MQLRLGSRRAFRRLQAHVGPVRLQLARFHAILQVRGQHFVDDLAGERGISDRESNLHAAKKIARHPICAGEINFGSVIVREIVNAAVLEKASHDADHANVFAEPWNLRAQTTDAANDQVDLHASAGSFVKLLDDLVVHERIQLHDHAAVPAGERVIAFALDQFDHAPLQVEGRDHEFFCTGITGESRERVEDNGDLVSQLSGGGKETEVGITARRSRMIISGGEMHILPEPIAIPADDQQSFAMRLQTDDAVDDVRSRFLETLGPLNVRRLVKARAQLDQRRDLFAGICGLDEGLDDR